MTSPARRQKTFSRISAKRCKSVRFEELRSLLEMHDWALDRVAKKNHYIYVHPEYEGTVNIPKPHSGDVKRPYCQHALAAIREVAGYEET